MQVSVEPLNGLERKLTISIPHADVEEEVSAKLHELAREVKIDGFRPGKVPMKIIISRFSDSVREKVKQDLIQPSLSKALKEKEIIPAGLLKIEPHQEESAQDFSYTAIVEVFPEISITELNQDEIEQTEAKIQSQDVADLLVKLQKQHAEWIEVSRPAKEKDKVVIDFIGTIDGETFDGGSQDNFEVELGSNSMIKGFEAGLVDKSSKQSFELDLTFPTKYQQEDLAGKNVKFAVTLQKVLEQKLPALDEDFAKSMGIKEGGVEALKKDIQANMERELERRISAANRERIFDKLLALNSFNLPVTLINQEIDHLKHEMFHHLFGPQHNENEKIPNFPRELFEEKAKRRVHLGLLLTEYVKLHSIKVDDKLVDAKIEKMADAYEEPEELRSWYNQPENRSELEAIVLEEMVAEKIKEKATIIIQEKTYDEVMNKSANEEDEGAED